MLIFFTIDYLNVDSLRLSERRVEVNSSLVLFQRLFPQKRTVQMILIPKQIAIVPNLRGEDDATRIRARIPAKLEKVQSIMAGRGDQHVEDLDRGESIRAPTQRHKLIHATGAVRPGRPHYIAHHIDTDSARLMTMTIRISLAPNYGRVNFSPIVRSNRTTK